MDHGDDLQDGRAILISSLADGMFIIGDCGSG